MVAVTVEEVGALMDEIGFKYDVRENLVLTGFATKTYKDPEGDNSLFLVIALEEDGEYFKLFAPRAFSIADAHEDVFLKACTAIQWKTKMIQFEYDETDGEVRPIIEFPLEDNGLTKNQLHRCVSAMVEILEAFYPTLDKAAKEGVIEFDDADKVKSLMLIKELVEKLGAGGTLTPEQMKQLEDVVKAAEEQAADEDDDDGPPDRI